ncbi:hypothetical protein F5H01DRAFT_380729 [Linnemannia elongata]|nr:hypothetical protein F5H01DRAFT_380729 [Linnemannia elongata]
MDPPRSTTQLTGLERPSPLDTPELLDRILSFLDPYTLASSALLVCRQWSDAGRRYHKPSEAEVISHISLSQDGVGHVAERTGGGCREPNTHRQEIQYDNATRARLREFEVYGDIRSGWVMVVLPLMPSLTRLKIRTIDGFFDHHIQIERIMRDCKHLESLHISRIDGRERLPGPWVPMTFLEHAPSLKELRIFDAAIQGKYVLFDTVGLAGLLRRLSLPLESFHISTADRTRDSDLLLYHNSQRRTLWSNEFTIYDLRKNQVRNNLTTLELVLKYGFVEYDNPRSALHNYLCSSPHLLHLKAPETCYPIAHMDFTDDSPSCLRDQKIFSPDRRNEVAPEPFSEIARVAFGYIARVCPDLRDISLGNGPYRPNTAQGHQAIQPPFDLRMQGGFCLLGCLKHLERIKIGRFTERAVLSPQNFEWMHESGRTEDKKAEREALLEKTWKSLRLMSHIRKSVVAVADVYANTGPGAQFNWTAVDPVLKEELRYLGWPVEVQTFFDELDKPAVKNGGGGIGSARGDGGVECFRALRYSCICAPSGFDLPPEQDYKRTHSPVKLPRVEDDGTDTDPKVSRLKSVKSLKPAQPNKSVPQAVTDPNDEAKESEDSIDFEDSDESCNDSYDDRETSMSAFGAGHPRKYPERHNRRGKHRRSWCRRKRYPDDVVTAEKYSTYIKESLAPRTHQDRNNSHLVRAKNVMRLIKDVARVKNATARRQAFEDIRTAMVYLDQRPRSQTKASLKLQLWYGFFILDFFIFKVHFSNWGQSGRYNGFFVNNGSIKPIGQCNSSQDTHTTSALPNINITNAIPTMTSTTVASALTIAEQDIFVTSAEWYTQSNAPEFIHRESSRTPEPSDKNSYSTSRSEAQQQQEAESQSNDAEYDISQDRQFLKFLRRFGGNRKSCK